MRIIYTKPFIYFFILLAFSVSVIFMHQKGWLNTPESIIVQAPRPLIYTLRGIGNYIVSFGAYFGQVSALNQTNAKLKQQVRDLEQQNADLQEAGLENQILKKELGFRSDTKYNLLSAEVIGKDPENFNQTVIINAGSEQGLTTGQAVLSQGVLVGKLTNVLAFTSKAMLVSDPQSAVDGALAATGDAGILRGSYGSGLVLDEISQHVQITKGQEVVTAGLNSQIPKGILIGVIGEVQSRANDLLQRATVIPAVDLKGLYFVSIVK